MNVYDSVMGLVGNTPLVELQSLSPKPGVRIFAKLEGQNPTGSIKDRMALHILESAYRAGAIRPGDTIAEATSGNTGIALSAIGRALGHPVVIHMPDWMSQERVALIRAFGARIVPVSKSQGGFLGSIRLCEELRAREGNVFLPCQFSNAANVEAHALTTGPEIEAQLAAQGLRPDALSQDTLFVGIDNDPVTARVAKALYPGQVIRCVDFDKAPLPSDFDLAIGNPPFSNLTVQNRTELGKLGLSLHDYFIARSLEHLRPGGIALFVTSRYSLDKSDPKARHHIDSIADFLGAVRLPGRVMRQEAGTDRLEFITYSGGGDRP